MREDDIKFYESVILRHFRVEAFPCWGVSMSPGTVTWNYALSHFIKVPMSTYAKHDIFLGHFSDPVKDNAYSLKLLLL